MHSCGRIQAQSADSYRNIRIFFIFKQQAILFSQMQNNHAKRVEFALIVLFTLIMLYFFHAVAIFGYIDFTFYLKEVGTKVNLHMWFIRKYIE